jgi:nucleotide-binding universal stress UspA family protein
MRILCPVDFTDSSERAVAFAGAWTRYLGAAITVIHVVPDDVRPQPGPELLEKLSTFSNVAGRPQLVLDHGDPATRINEQARALGSDLIVMGTHGRRGFDRWLLGSVAERVLHRAPCPVVTVTRGAESKAWLERPLRRILCGAELTASSTALPYAFALARQCHAELIVLHALEELTESSAAGGVPFEYAPILLAEAIEVLESAISKKNREAVPIQQRVVAGRAYKQILLHAAAEKADLIVIGVHAASATGLFFGSTAHHVVRGAPCPVLTVRGGTPMADESTNEETRA